MNITTYFVPDMSCGHCKARIEKEVNKIAGVHSTNVKVDTKILTVQYDENLVENEDIIAAVSEAGYTAEKH